MGIVLVKYELYRVVLVIGRLYVLQFVKNIGTYGVQGAICMGCVSAKIHETVLCTRQC